MRRHILPLLVLLLAAAQAHADEPSDHTVTDVGLATLYAYVGSAAPKAGDIFLGCGLLLAVADDDARDTPREHWAGAAGYTTLGAYDLHAAQRGTPQGRVFLTNLLILGGTVVLAGPHHGGSAAAPAGFYARPLPAERGALVGYQWTF